MPGPRNSTKRKKGRKSIENQHQSPAVVTERGTLPAKPLPLPPPLVFFAGAAAGGDDEALPREPPIHDPGNGPRVKNMHAFLRSLFAAAPSLDDELCAEFAQEEVLDMLSTVLPYELAMCLWYNKSRKTSKICPCCRRLYRLGDVMSNLLEEAGTRRPQREPHALLRVEQEISGLCSPACFIIASINYPEAIRLIYGRVAEEMEEVTWEFLNTAGDGREDEGMSMLLRMTRLHDLGLAQLCLPGVEFDHDDF